MSTCAYKILLVIHLFQVLEPLHSNGLINTRHVAESDFEAAEQ